MVLPASRAVPLAVMAFAFAFMPFAPLTASQGPSQVPCTDPRGCPDLETDPLTFAPFQETRTFSPNSCAVREGVVEPGARKLLRFTFTTPNRGPGDLVVGVPETHPEWFEEGTCHGHLHFREYADYRLWTPADFQAWNAARAAAPDKTPAQVLAETGLAPVEGHKQGFCLIDIRRYGGLPAPRYLLCQTQGISVGWADEYHWSLDGQWIDVTNVPLGTYVLEAEVNAERLFQETNYANNRAGLVVNVK